MPNLFTLIGNAWRFYRKQPALNAVVFWFLFLPLAALNVLTRMLMPPEGSTMGPDEYVGMMKDSPAAILVFLPAMLILSFIAIWGTACILLVGKRLIQSKAGRARTSFASVRKDAIPYVLPLFLTGILRACFTFFWALPGVLILFAGIIFWVSAVGNPSMIITENSPWMWLVIFLLPFSFIPSIIYNFRTAFYEVVVVGESKFYRTALQKSKQVVRGHTWRVFFYIVGLSVVLFAPPSMIASRLETLIVAVEPRFAPASDVFSAALGSGATLLFLLANMSLYGALKKARPQHIEG